MNLLGALKATKSSAGNEPKESVRQRVRRASVEMLETVKQIRAGDEAIVGRAE